ncbi:MAG TPA: sulfotransferase [Rhizomicrobium sp.]|jgi:tetratricopeptide (TPR) repeat protein|nr:sulfotransferase [Rhizomicrobium sp.]
MAGGQTQLDDLLMTPDATLQLYLREADAALRANDTGRALRIADEAIAKGLEHPNLLTLSAHHRMHAGEDEAALTLLARARTMSPRSVDILNAQGICLVRLGRAREALPIFNAALRIAPGTGMLRFNKALAFEKLGELDHVRRELESVLTLMPRHHEALAWLATLATRRNDGTAARDYAERALALQPGIPAAILALATVEVADRNFAAASARLRPLLADPDLSPADRSMAQSLLGDALDGEDLPHDAFTAYAAAKATMRKFYASTYEAGAFESAANRVRRLTDYFRNADETQWRADRSEATSGKPAMHVFLVGFPRSGTTLLEQVLASHPEIEAMEERDALMDAVADFIRPEDGTGKLAHLPSADLQKYREAYWKRAAEFGHGAKKTVFVDKMPLNTVLLPLVAKLFPTAKILFALRDPRDVVLSCFRRRFGMTAQMYELTSLETAVSYYDAVMGLGEIYRDKLGLDTTDTRHEDLLADFDAETRRLCQFLGLEWREEMKNFASRARASTIDTPSGAQVARGLTREGADQWRRYADELAPVLPKLAPWIARFGYPEA